MLIDADTREPVRSTRVSDQMAAATVRRWIACHRYRDFLLVDMAGRPVPLPHPPLPTEMLGGLSCRARYLRWRAGLDPQRMTA